MSLHPVIRKAAKGRLPAWAQVTKSRYAHMARVAELLERWARALGLSKSDRKRWVAAGYLHDAVKTVPAAELVGVVPRDLRGLPGAILHGPAAAQLLKKDGVEDEELLLAIRYHTLGHPELSDIGRALYAADFLEPGRRIRPRWREGLRARMPAELDEVAREIVRARIHHLLRKDRPVQPETFAFWNAMTQGAGWERASEA